MQCSAVQCSIVQCSAVQYSAVQYNTVQCSAVPFFRGAGLADEGVFFLNFLVKVFFFFLLFVSLELLVFFVGPVVSE